jgi:hypothetical protein
VGVQLRLDTRVIKAPLRLEVLLVAISDADENPQA